jgi:hypothetical protein
VNFLSLQGKPARACPETLDTRKMKRVPWVRRAAIAGAKALLILKTARGPEGPLFHGDAKPNPIQLSDRSAEAPHPKLNAVEFPQSLVKETR